MNHFRSFSKIFLCPVLTISLVLTVAAGCGSTPEPTASSPGLNQRIEAARVTATNNSACKDISPFYWEIGDQSSMLVSGSTGDGSVLATTNYSIASATKLLFGAYVVQKTAGTLSQAAIKQLTMSSGYTNFGLFSCAGSSVTTVQECYNASTNSTYTAANDGKFFYNGGHFQKWAMDNGLGSMTRSQLATEFQSQLGSDIALTFVTTQLAGGVNTNAAEYAKFLRKVLSGGLLMKNYLGSDSVCTQLNANPACLTAVSSPVPENIEYSLGHWVEVGTGDGAFSSAGLYGFYPWIDSTKTYYGVISRYQVPTANDEIGAGYASMLCGRQIRRAFATGSAQ